MSETLILILGHEPNAPASWAFVDGVLVVEAGVVETAAGLGSIAARAASAGRVAAVLPGEQVAMRSLASPPKSSAKFRAAASYLLEDELAENLEALHVATTLRGGTGEALAVKKSVIDAWMDAFAESDISPDIMTADFALLPAAPDTAFFMVESLRIVGAVAGAGFSAERPLADELAVSLAQGETVSRIVAYSDADSEPVAFVSDEVEWRAMTGPAAIFELLAEGLERDLAANFLHGAYRKKRDWRAEVGHWARTGVLAAACAAVMFLATLADAVRSSRLAAALDRKSAEVHAAAFPGAADSDPQAHARRILGSRSGDPAFLRLSSEFAQGLEEVEDVQIDRLRYNALRAEFSVNLRFSDINNLEAFKQALTARGVATSETGGVRRAGAQYIGELEAAL